MRSREIDKLLARMANTREVIRRTEMISSVEKHIESREEIDKYVNNWINKRIRWGELILEERGIYKIVTRLKDDETKINKMLENTDDVEI